VTRLIDASQDLSDGERQVIRDRLVAGGVIRADQQLTWRDDASDKLQKLLEFDPSEDADPQRSLSTVDLLVECVLALNKLTLRTWQEIAPKEKLIDRAKLARDLKRYLAGDPDVAREQISQDLEQLRGLVASLIFAIKNAPREWAHRHIETYGVEAVQGAVAAEGVKFLDNREKRCWEKYRQLASSLDQLSLSQEILNVVAEFATRIRESGKV